MLVTRVLGPCPVCGHERYGNVDVYGNHVLRGCERCRASEQVWLPALRKKVLYLDQPFFSGAFRGGERNRHYVELADHIQRAASAQLVTIPRSSIHDYETRLWERGDELLEFIKRTSRGHTFERAYNVERRQILTGFSRWLAGEVSAYPLVQREALSERVHDWDGYFVVGVRHQPGDNEAQREFKRQSLEGLLNLFDGWRASEETFEQCVAGELAGAKRLYLDAFLTYFIRVGQGDFSALFDSPIVSQVVEQMRHFLPPEQTFQESMRACGSFFDSEHFAQLPFQHVRASSYATLQRMVRNGAYVNRERARGKLSGFYSDVDHAAFYAPYCDAIALDQAMAELMGERGVGLEQTFGVKVFSLNHLEEFHGWLDELEAGVTDEHRQALSNAYPE